MHSRFLSVVLLWPWLGAAQPLSWPEVRRLARESAPEVRLSSRAVAEAIAAGTSAGLILPTNPRLSTEGRLSGGSTPGLGYAVGLDVQVEVSGVGAKRVAEARERVELARSELALAVSASQARAWSLGVDLSIAHQRVAWLEKLVELQQRVQRASLERKQAGVAAEPELEAVAVELASWQVARTEAQAQVVAAEFGLRTALDLSATEKVQVPLVQDAPTEEESLADLLVRAADRRPELAAQRARWRVVEATLARLERDVVPKLGILGGVDAQASSPTYGLLGLSIELPVAQRNQASIAVARAQRETEQERARLLERHIAREVALSHARYWSHRARLELLTRAAIPAAENAARLVEDGWRAGRFDVFRLTVVLRDLLRAHMDALEALRSSWVEFIELQRLSGGLQ